MISPCAPILHDPPKMPKHIGGHVATCDYRRFPNSKRCEASLDMPDGEGPMDALRRAGWVKLAGGITVCPFHSRQ